MNEESGGKLIETAEGKFFEFGKELRKVPGFTEFRSILLNPSLDQISKMMESSSFEHGFGIRVLKIYNAKTGEQANLVWPANDQLMHEEMRNIVEKVYRDFIPVSDHVQELRSGSSQYLIKMQLEQTIRWMRAPLYKDPDN